MCYDAIMAEVRVCHSLDTSLSYISLGVLYELVCESGLGVPGGQSRGPSPGTPNEHASSHKTTVVEPLRYNARALPPAGGTSSRGDEMRDGSVWHGMCESVSLMRRTRAFL